MPLTYRAAPQRPRPTPSPSPRPTRPLPPPDTSHPTPTDPTHPRPTEPTPTENRPPLTTPRSAHVPPDLAAALCGSHRVDVSLIPVHRGPEVSAEARTLGARAFTRGGEVFLPAEAGPLDTPKARGLLAHELVHAVQQRTLGTTLPAAHTPAGLALEAEAVAAEAAHAEPAPLVHPSLTQVIGQAARTVGVQLAPVAALPPTLQPASPLSAPSTQDPMATELTPPVRDEIDLIAESRAIRTLEEWTAPTGDTEPGPTADLPEEPPVGRSPQDQAMAEQILQVINAERAQTGEPVLNTLDANAMDLIRRTITEQNQEAAARSVIFAQATAAGGVETEPATARTAQPLPTERDEVAVPPPPPQPVERVESVVPQPVPVAVPPPAPAQATVATDPSDQPIEIERLDLEQLTARLYDRLRTRIRMELLIDRERAGLLTDFR